jgi:hypothetical protein
LRRGDKTMSKSNKKKLKPLTVADLDDGKGIADVYKHIIATEMKMNATRGDSYLARLSKMSPEELEKEREKYFAEEKKKRERAG